jgi:phosphoserine phosphatase
MTTMILTRHGHIEGIDPPRFRGRTEVPLSPLGELQAIATAERISRNWRPVAIYTSPLGRCIATGEIIANGCGLTVTATDSLADLDYGEWQWKTHAQMRRRASPLITSIR